MKVTISKAIAICSAIVLGLALVAQPAAAGPMPRKAGPLLTHEQVLHIALTEARDSQDPHPKRIEMATGTLSSARRVMEPGGSTSPAGAEVVDLVVMRGRFQINAPHPRKHPIRPGKVLCLVIDAHTGFVEARSLGDKAPLLSQLGQVTRLR